MNEPRVDPKDKSLDAKVDPDPVDPDPADVKDDKLVDDKLETVPMSELRNVRKEAAKYRTQLRALQEKQATDAEAVKLAAMTETDRLKAEARAAEAKVVSMKAHSDNVLRRSAIINAASVANFLNPQDAAKLLDISEIDVDEAGNIDPQQVVEQVRALAEERPYLLKSANAAGSGAEFGPTSPASENAPGVKLSGDAAVDKLKAQSKAAMAKGQMNAAIKLYNQAWEKERGKPPA